jgi:hypothetical protein
MKKSIFIIAFFIFSISSSKSFAQCGHMGHDGHSLHEKSPAVAALLSLQPMPIDFGNFYAGNWKRGIVYTIAEVSLFVPAMSLVRENSGWWGGMHRGYYRYNYTYTKNTWSKTEKEQFYYLLAGYVLTKTISAFDAGFSVEKQKKHISVIYDKEKDYYGLNLSLGF